MDRDVVIASACGIGVVVAWLIRASAKERAAVVAAEEKSEKAASATARAVQNSIKGRR